MEKILHFVKDNKYIDWFIDVISQYFQNDLHTFVYITNNSNVSYKNIRKNVSRIKIIKENQVIDYIKKNDYKIIILHGLPSIPYMQLSQIPKGIIVVWKAWGYDIYTQPKDYYRPLIPIKNLYRKKTKKILYPTYKARIRRFKKVIRGLLHKKAFENSIKRIDYFSGVIAPEYSLMKQYNSFFHAKQTSFGYFRMEQLKQSEENELTVNGDNILIGNSGDPTNNHLDAFDLVKKVNIGDRKIYSFLSYGGTEEYRKKVIAEGKKNWGDNFIPITEFLSFDDFNKIIADCGNVIYFHERQQAGGNINQALSIGCKLFLSDTSCFYNHKKMQGYTIFNIFKDFNEKELAKPMDLQIKRKNHDILEGIKFQRLDRLKDFFNKMNEEATNNIKS